MMKKILVYAIGLMLALPVPALAEGLGEVTLPMLMARAAFIQAEASGLGIGCSISTSAKTARVNEAFVVAWGSYGAYAPELVATSTWTPSGMQIIRAEKPGTYEYRFQFAGPRGVATCFSQVTVSTQ